MISSICLILIQDSASTACIKSHTMLYSTTRRSLAALSLVSLASAQGTPCSLQHPVIAIFKWVSMIFILNWHEQIRSAVSWAVNSHAITWWRTPRTYRYFLSTLALSLYDSVSSCSHAQKRQSTRQHSFRSLGSIAHNYEEISYNDLKVGPLDCMLIALRKGFARQIGPFLNKKCPTHSSF